MISELTHEVLLNAINSNGRCDACAYGEQAPIDPANIGAPRGVQCRRYPPTPLVVPARGGVAIEGIWPVLVADAYCGEFKARNH